MPSIRSAPIPHDPSVASGWDAVAVREVEDPHDHEIVAAPSDDLSIVVVTSGSYVIESARERGRWEHALLAPGRSASTPPGREINARWSARSDQVFRSAHVVITSTLLADVASSYPADRASSTLNFLSRDDDFVRASVLELTRASRAGAPGMYAETLGIAVTAHLLGASAASDSRDGRLSARDLAIVVDVMTAELASPLTVETLARTVHLSRFHFLRRFTAATGVTPMRFLTSLRMDRARRLLHDPALTVAAVAQSCGYSTAAAFTAAFQRHHLTTPGEFRRSTFS